MVNLVLALAGLGLWSAAVASSGPTIKVRIQSNWQAPDQTTQFLQSLAIEKPQALFPFLHYLATNPPSSIDYHSTTNQIQLGESGTALPAAQVTVDWSALSPSQAYSTLHRALNATALLTKSELASLDLSLAAREGSVAIESFKQLELKRQAVVRRSGADEGGIECDNWVEVGGFQACTVDELWAVVGPEQKETDGPLMLTDSSSAPAPIYANDHLIPSANPDHLPILIMYANPAISTFAPLFLALGTLAAPPTGQSRIQLALRRKSTSVQSVQGINKLALSGYGALLDIKKVDYIAIDDRAKKTDSADGGAAETTGRGPRIHPLTEYDLNMLSMRFAQSILESASPLEAFANGTADFPLVASTLSDVEVTQALFEEVSMNQGTQRAAQAPSFTVNGLSQPLGSALDPFLLLRVLREERRTIEGLLSLNEHITGHVARELLILGGQGGEAHGGIETMLGELFDARDLAEGGGLITWWNDLEKDGRYKPWPTSVRDFLRPSYPGQMSLVARNLFNLVLALDLSQPEHVQFIVDTVPQYIARKIPIRFGVVPVVAEEGHEAEDPATAVAAVMWHLIDTVGRSTSLKVMGELTAASPEKPITLNVLRTVYDRFARTYTNGREPVNRIAPNLDTLLQEHFDLARVSQAREWATRLGVREGGLAGQGGYFLNGAYFPFDQDLGRNLQQTMNIHFQFAQQKVYYEELTDDTPAEDFFSTLPTVRPRRNRWIFSSDERPLQVVNLVDAIGKDLLGALEYTQAETDNEVPVATVLVVTDLTDPAGIKLAQEALQFINDSPSARLALIHNPAATLHAGVALDELEEVMGTPGQHATAHFETYRRTLPLALGLHPGHNAIVVNGRMVGPFENYAFQAADFASLLAFELEQRIKLVVEALNGLLVELPQGRELSDLYALAGSVVQRANLPDSNAGMFAAPHQGRARAYQGLSGESSTFTSGDELSALFEIAVVLDPATELAQRWAPILLTLSKLPAVFIKVYLNPTITLTEMPIKRFYRFNFPLAPTFDLTTGHEIQPAVEFAGLPEDVLFTLGLEAQKAWLTFPVEAVHDLDNIRLADLGPNDRQAGVEAVYELENLLVEGHARELVGAKPPRGLQLELVPVDFVETGVRPSAQVQADTIVMSNLGYFQLKANPGPWRLALRPGRPSEVYALESVGREGWKSATVEEAGDGLVVGTLEGLTLYPRFKRNPGEELTDLLAVVKEKAEGKEEGGWLGKVKGVFGGSKAAADEGAVVASGPKQADINIFTVASGLLYERMALLMFVSVMRHTESTVKFWLITNFLSPAFKEFLPEMAKEYGFDYELVTYQWPHWLRGQKEKQRFIWGYKILFLDVLFPLDLERVIFVDSDQIVRADLKELVDLDLKGAPYGYTPMGDSRPEMEGFRFWKSGYWKSHLAGLPYHISALYVIDLKRFRQLAAGDLLRQQYQSLSADPNSLSNLDQDLPNNLQRQIPIYSLPEEWLWCETWCSDESLARAKTIDLCNNPLTKEPKLDRARRQIPEWTVYDDEVAALAQRVASRKEGGAGQAFAVKADRLGQAVQQKQEQVQLQEEKRGREEL